MTGILLGIFSRRNTDTISPKGRAAYSTFGALTGIVCNMLLFAVKYIVGTASSSISIISDAFNNLSDSAGCIVTLIGCRMAAKPADKDHPFGHGRGEYLTGLIIAVMIFLVGFELLRASALKILQPGQVSLGIFTAVTMIVSIILKLWLSGFYKAVGRLINSPVMAASAQDSRNDVIATAAALAGAAIESVTGLPADGIMGVLVSVFVLKAGYGIIKDTVDDLLGKPADSEEIEKIRHIVISHKRIIGVHDIMVHNYGPSKKLASCHAEVRSDENLLDIHEIIDDIEREIMRQTGIDITIHIDPVDIHDHRRRQCRALLRTRFKSIDSRLHIHDFRVADIHGQECAVFDLVVPYDFAMTDEQLKAVADETVQEFESGLKTEITFDRG